MPLIVYVKVQNIPCSELIQDYCIYENGLETAWPIEDSCLEGIGIDMQELEGLELVASDPDGDLADLIMEIDMEKTVGRCGNRIETKLILISYNVLPKIPYSTSLVQQFLKNPT